MTRKEFDRVRLGIEKEKFVGDYSDAISFGIKRAEFEQQRFQRLMAAAAEVPGSKTVRTKLEIWKRQLERAGEAQRRLEKIQHERVERQSTAS